MMRSTMSPQGTKLAHGLRRIEAAACSLARSCRPVFARGHLAAFEQLFEAAQIIPDLTLGVFAHEPGDRSAKLTRGRVVLELHLYLARALAGRRNETARAHKGRDDRKIPRSNVGGMSLIYLDPIAFDAERTASHPVKWKPIGHAHLFQVSMSAAFLEVGQVPYLAHGPGLEWHLETRHARLRDAWFFSVVFRLGSRRR